MNNARYLAVAVAILSINLVSACDITERVPAMEGSGVNSRKVFTIVVPEESDHALDVKTRLAFPISVESTLQNVSTIVRGHRVDLSAAQVERPQMGEIILTGGNGGSVRIAVTVENTSARGMELRAGMLLRSAEYLAGLYDDKHLYTRSLNLAYLEGRISHEKLEHHLAAFRPSEVETYTSFLKASETLRSTLEQYRQGLVPETPLESALTDAQVALKEHGKYGARQLSAISKLTEGLVPDLKSGSLIFREGHEIYSRFEGEEQYGSYGLSGWTYSGDYRFLTKYIASASDLEACQR